MGGRALIAHDVESMNSVKRKTSLDFQEEIYDSLMSKLVSTKSAKGFIETMGLSLKLLRSIFINHSFAKFTKT